MKKFPRRAPLAALFLLALAGLVTYTVAAPWWRQDAARTQPARAEATDWYCPMHPEVMSDQAGNCPICGMALVRNASGQTVRHSDQFHVTPPTQARMGIVVEPVAALSFRPSLRVPAELVADERRAVSVSPKVDGWIKRLGVSGVGQAIRKGELLFEIYAPELQQRQREYIEFLNRKDALQAQAGGMSAIGNVSPNMMMGSMARERHRLRSRLAAADVPETVLQAIEKYRRVHDSVPVLAAHDGVVTAIGAREGSYVMPAQPVMSYANLAPAWVEVSLTLEQLSLLDGPGQGEVELRPLADPTERLVLPLDSASAIVDPVSRLARVRVRLTSARHRWHAGGLLDALVRLAPRTALAVKKDAVIHTGHGDFVIVSDDAQHFRQLPVQLGAETADEVEVLAGLVPGQGVVTNGQFLLSAEASLQATRQRLALGRPDRAPQPATPPPAAATALPRPVPTSHAPMSHAHDEHPR